MSDQELTTLIGFELRRAYAWSSRRFSEILADSAIKPGQYSLLYAIDESPGQTLGFLAERLALDPANLAPLLNDLEKRDYIARVVHADDRRARAIELKPPGRKALEQARKAIEAHEALISRGLTATQRRTLTKLLQTVSANARAGER